MKFLQTNKKSSIHFHQFYQFRLQYKKNFIFFLLIYKLTRQTMGRFITEFDKILRLFDLRLFDLRFLG